MASSDNILCRYPVPRASVDAPWRTEILIKKSRFVTRSFRCAEAEELKNFIASLRQKEADASHHCWAFVAGGPGDSAQIGCSDDGEPHGTAGKPMLNILLHSGVGQIGAVTSRWFGGIKLGTGGLVRAYQSCVRENLLDLPIIELMPKEKWTVLTDYQSLEAIKRALPELETELLEEKFQDKVELVLNAPIENGELLAKKLSGLSRGTAILRRIATLV